MVLHITPSERLALQLLADGAAASELAGRLGVTELEIEAALRSLFSRMGAASRSQAIAAAVRRGLLTDDPAARFGRPSS